MKTKQMKNKERKSRQITFQIEKYTNYHFQISVKISLSQPKRLRQDMFVYQ